MDPQPKESIRSELRKLTPDGDLVGLANELRRMGVDSLLVCRPGGRIDKVLSEHRIRRLAQPVPTGVPFIPEQVAPNHSPGTQALPEGEGIRAQAG